MHALLDVAIMIINEFKTVKIEQACLAQAVQVSSAFKDTLKLLVASQSISLGNSPSQERQESSPCQFFIYARHIDLTLMLAMACIVHSSK